MRWVAAVAVLVIVAVAWWLVRDDEVAVVPAVPELAVEPPSVTPPQQPAVEPPKVAVVAEVPAPDAGVVASAHDVIFDVRRDGVYAVGLRLTVSQGTERESGLVNVMGGLTLPLRPGAWTVHNDDVTPREFEVTDETKLVALEQRVSRPVGGRVVTVAGALVPGIEVRVGDARVRTRGAGRFSTTTSARQVDVYVRDGDRMSATKRVEPPVDDVELVVEDLYPLELDVGARVANVSVSHRLGVASVSCDETCTVKVPTGDYRVVAISRRRGTVLMARAEGTQGQKGDHRVLSFSPAPPVTGTVTNSAGAPLADVLLRMVPALAATDSSSWVAISKRDGSFSFDNGTRGSTFEPGWNSPSWRIEAVAPWHATPVYVSFGDAPVSVVAEVLPPSP